MFQSLSANGSWIVRCKRRVLERYRRRLGQEYQDAQALLSRYRGGHSQGPGRVSRRRCRASSKFLRQGAFLPSERRGASSSSVLSERRLNAFPRKTSACAYRAARPLTVSVWTRYPGRRYCRRCQEAEEQNEVSHDRRSKIGRERLVFSSSRSISASIRRFPVWVAAQLDRAAFCCLLS